MVILLYLYLLTDICIYVYTQQNIIIIKSNIKVAAREKKTVCINKIHFFPHRIYDSLTIFIQFSATQMEKNERKNPRTIFL